MISTKGASGYLCVVLGIMYSLVAMLYVLLHIRSSSSGYNAESNAVDSNNMRMDILKEIPHKKLGGSIKSAKMCKVLKYMLTKGLQIEQTQIDYDRLDCDAKLGLKSNEVIKDKIVPESAASVLPSDAADRCRRLKEEHKVLVGFSWGTLSIADQKLWHQLQCDLMFTVDEPVETKSDKEWCEHILQRYSVIPMKSWGSLPFDLTSTWRSKACDSHFIEEKKSLRAPNHCSTVPRSDWLRAVHTVHGAARPGPLVAILAGSTTRGIDKPSLERLALCNYLLKSIERTAECHYRYLFVLGYDEGDPFYDYKSFFMRRSNIELLEEWFRKKVQNPLEAVGISIELRTVPVENSIKKPGPVFIAMAREAYKAGADFFYRVNDDTEMLSLWTNIFVHSIVSLSPPFGAVGPLSFGTDNRILTHDFVHRTHMDIFDMNYYPPEFTDWWCDDWISVVYGSERTFSADAVLVTHHTGAHGQRYNVDGTVEAKLPSLVLKGREKIREWMVRAGVANTLIMRFDSDSRVAFTRKSAPPLPEKRNR